MSVESVLRGAVGIVLLIGIAFLFSNNRRKINWRLVISGIAIQLIFAILVIHGEVLRSWFFVLGWPKDIINWLGGVVVSLLGFITDGSKFVFGSLAVNSGTESLGVFFAFQVLPTIIFFAALTSLLYYLGILQIIVKAMAWVMARLMRTSGAESLSCAANIFLGQTEAPLLVRPFIGAMTRSELYTIMVGGMATVAGGVLASFVQMLGQALATVQDISVQEAQIRFAVHLIAASTMSAPAAIVIAKILCPEVDTPKTMGTVRLKVEKTASNAVEAIAVGASTGLKLALNVGAMLIVFIAFISLLNYLLLELGDFTHINSWLQDQYSRPLSLQLILGIVLKYLAVGIGVPLKDAFHFASLFGTKVALNEFVAYIGLVDMIKEGVMSEKGIYMATFGLCGFANFSSIGIQIGGISPLAPHRRKDIASLGLRAVLGGGLATLMTATLAGILLA